MREVTSPRGWTRPARYAIAYAAAALVWIVASDLIVDAADAETPAINILKGVAFILATSLLLAALLRRHEIRVAVADQRARDEMRDIVDQSTEAVYVVDRDGRFLLINRALGDLLGIVPEDAVGRAREEVLDVMPMGGDRSIDLEVERTGQPAVVIEEFGDGDRRRRFRSTRFPIRDRAGQVSGIGCIAVDITDEERIQEQLRSSEAAYRMMFESSPVPMWIHDEATLQIVAVNESAIQRYGYDRTSFCQLRVTDLAPSAERPHRFEESVRNTSSVDGSTVVHCTADGVAFVVELASTSTKFEGRDAAVVLARDVTDEVHTAERNRLLLELPDLYAHGSNDAFLVEVVQRMVEITESTGARLVPTADPGDEILVGVAPESEARCLSVTADGDAGEVAVLLGGKSMDYTAADELACRLVMHQAHRVVERGRFVRDLELAARQQKDTLEGITRAVGAIIDARDPYTAGHQQRVGDLAAAIARRLGLSDSDVEGIRIGGYLHDVGKIAIPAEILTRSGPLDPLEHQLVHRHSRAGRDILSSVPFPWPIALMVDQHHERLDGSGYPEALRAGEIIRQARIIAVADVFDAITSVRPYRSERSPSVAIEQLREGAGVVYDAEAVEALIAHVEG